MKQHLCPLACFALVCAPLSVWADDVDQHTSIERLVRCQASLQEVARFNDLVDQKAVDFSTAEKFAPWGGAAWTIEPAVSMEGLHSDVVLMTDRASFYMRILSDNPKADIRRVAEQLKLAKAIDEEGGLDYTKRDGDKTVRVMSSDDADAYLLGCSYDMTAVQRARKAAANETPERIERKARMQKMLSD
jgi:hypothetical protein